MKTRLKKLLTRKVLIHSVSYKPGTYIKRIRCRGKIFVRVAFPHLKKYHDRMPVTDIPWEDVTAIERLPSKLQKWAAGLIGLRVRGKTYKINHEKKKP